MLDTAASSTTDTPLAQGEAAAPRIIVALDGPASSGKSSVGAAAAGRLGLRFVDTGLVYRAVTAIALRDRIATSDAERLVPLVDRISLADDGTGRLTRVLLDGVDATDEVHSPDVDASVSTVSRLAPVRSALLARQRSLAATGGIIVAGRDIGTVVLPDADLKLFLEASLEARSARRIAERGLDPEGASAAVVRAQLRRRDEQDRTREVAPLRVADDAVVIKTDGVSFDGTVDLVVEAIREAETSLAAKTAAAAPIAAAPIAAAPIAAGATAAARVPAARGAAASEGTGARTWALSNVLERAMRLENDLPMWMRMIALLSRIGARLFADVRVEGLDRIPRDGAVILAINHASNADPFVTGAWVTAGLRNRRLHWLGKRELFAWPVFGWLVARGGVHPVDRGTADVEAFRLATRILERGYVLLLFPEGTRSPNGALQEARDGLATLAIRTGATIVPIGVNDSDLVWPRGRKIPLPFPRRRITVRVGTPFRTDDVVPEGTDRRAAKTIATTAIMGRIAALLQPRQRGFYADAVAVDEAPESDMQGATTA
jgi:cytidylate kinase